MLKLLIWGIIGYFVYRYFQSKLGLMMGGDNPGNPANRFRKPPPEAPKKEEDSDYIDYEEIK